MAGLVGLLPLRIKLLVGFGGKNEIAFREAIDFMSPDREFYLTPGEIDIRMMILLFGKLANFVGEGERFPKVFEFIFFGQVMLINGLPVVAELL